MNLRYFLLTIFSFYLSTAMVASAISPLFPIESNKITSKPLVLFKGRVSNLDSLTINSQPVKINENGQYFFKVWLHTPKKYHFFTLQGTDKSQKVHRKSYKIYYQPSSNYASTKPALYFDTPRYNLIKSLPFNISGKALNLSSLMINESMMNIDQNGAFNYLVKSQKNHDTIRLDIHAKDSKNISIYTTTFFDYSVDIPPKTDIEKTASPTQNILSTNTQDTTKVSKQTILKTIEFHYEHLGWSALTDENEAIQSVFDQIQPFLLSKDNLKQTIQSSSAIYSMDQALLCIVPFFKQADDTLNLYNNLANQFFQYFNSPESITILLYNSDFSIWEVSYSIQQNKLTPFSWVLNDLTINPNDLSNNDKMNIHAFKQGSFSL